MTKFLLITTFLLLQKIAFSQLIITGGLPGDTSTPAFTYQIDTLRSNGDTTFYEISQFNDSVLVHKEQQISIDADRPELIPHGTTEQWYIDGSKKLQGQFELGEKKGLWKYWDKKGKLRMDADRETFGRSLRGEPKFFIDGEPVEIRKE